MRRQRPIPTQVKHTIYLDRAREDWLYGESESSGLSMSKIVNEALAYYASRDANLLAEIRKIVREELA
jgi:hypothetical protein